MPTTFNVISLGNSASIDTTEGNQTAENASSLVGQTFGGPSDALVNDIVSFSSTGAGFSGGGSTYYDMNNSVSNDTFSIDGGPSQTFDGTSVYNATLTYLDGTTSTISAVVFQDTDGNTYLAPEFSANSDQAALEAGGLRSLTLDSLAGSRYSGMTGSREAFNAVTCFVKGVHIETEHGACPVEDLVVGQLLMTRDHGLQPVRWIGQSTRAAFGRFQPIRISSGALGAGLPRKDLMVSPQHRMLVKSRIAERMTGAEEVLIPAKKLLGCTGVARATDLVVAVYYHVLLDRHEIIFAEGAPTESLLTGPLTQEVIGDDAFAEVAALFPDIARSGRMPARIIPKGHQMRSLVARHAKNVKPFL